MESGRQKGNSNPRSGSVFILLFVRAMFLSLFEAAVRPSAI